MRDITNPAMKDQQQKTDNASPLALVLRRQSIPSALSLRCSAERSMPTNSAVREMLPPNRLIWATRYSRSKTSRASRKGSPMRCSPQLAHVAGPVVRLQHGHGVLADQALGQPRGLRDLVHEIFDQVGNILAPLG